jgi:NADPH-dependent ferric siderophore reductase
MQRLRLAGTDIGHFDTAANLHVRLHVPARLNTNDIPEFRAFMLGERGNGDALVATRYYTIRRMDAEAGWLDIDFALHDDAGPGSHFCVTAKPGDLCGLSGPCGLGVGRAEHYLIAGDETALSAIARISESLPETATGNIFMFADVNLYGTSFRVPGGMELKWIADHERTAFFGDAAAFGKTLTVSSDKRFTWIAGERNLVGDFRPIISGVKKKRYLCVPYWGR